MCPTQISKPLQEASCANISWYKHHKDTSTHKSKENRLFLFLFVQFQDAKIDVVLCAYTKISFCAMGMIRFLFIQRFFCLLALHCLLVFCFLCIVFLFFYYCQQFIFLCFSSLIGEINDICQSRLSEIILLRKRHKNVEYKRSMKRQKSSWKTRQTCGPPNDSKIINLVKDLCY